MSTTRTFFLLMSIAIVFVGVIAGLLFGASKTLAATIHWDGGGADTNWSTAVNWSTDTVPGSGDVALFNASSTTNTLIDSDIQVLGISVESGYLGTITQTLNSSVTIGTNGFALNGGTLTVEAGKTQTILAALRLAGQPNAYLSLRSSQNGSQYSIDPKGTIVIEYVDLKDANNISAALIDTREKSVLHSGNNTNWIFGSTVSAPGGSFYITPPSPEMDKTKTQPEDKPLPVPKKEQEPVKEEEKPISEVKPVPAMQVVPKPELQKRIFDRKTEAMVISTGDFAPIRESLQIKRNLGAEQRAIPLIQKVLKGKAQLNQSEQTYALINFIAYGSAHTRYLGFGERMGVVDSFVSAYGKLPVDASDWETVISIANGDRPAKRSPQA